MHQKGSGVQSISSSKLCVTCPTGGAATRSEQRFAAEFSLWLEVIFLRPIGLLRRPGFSGSSRFACNPNHPTLDSIRRHISVLIPPPISGSRNGTGQLIRLQFNAGRYAGDHDSDLSTEQPYVAESFFR